MATDSSTKPPLLVTAAIIVQRDRVLVTRRPAGKRDPLLWEFPGGKMEPGESPQQALQRELREELALDVRVGEIFDVVYYRYPWGPILLLAYQCHWTGGEITHLEVDTHCWATPADLQRLPFLAADRPLVEMLYRVLPHKPSPESPLATTKT